MLLILAFQFWYDFHKIPDLYAEISALNADIFTLSSTVDCLPSWPQRVTSGARMRGGRVPQAAKHISLMCAQDYSGS